MLEMLDAYLEDLIQTYRPSCAFVPPKTGIRAMFPFTRCAAGFSASVTLSGVGKNERSFSVTICSIWEAFAARKQVRLLLKLPGQLNASLNAVHDDSKLVNGATR